MIRNIFIVKFPAIPVIILISACAKISAPTGGPRDREPPVVVKSLPVNGTKNFKGNRITITFNEFVVLDKINEKFMVSPPLAKKPKVYLRGKSVNIEYEEKLKDSTTYTFYFQDAIRDLTEGNPINNFQFVFSTGPVIDSLSVTGNVYTALTLDPPDETLVLLYSELADSSVIKHIPAYISRTTRTGYFRIDNVRKGKYRLYALKDADNSKSFNLPDEEFAFLKEPVEITSEKNFLPVRKDTVKIKPLPLKTAKVNPVSVKTADTIVIIGEYKLILFKPAKKTHYLTSSSRSVRYKLTYTLSLPPGSEGFSFSVPRGSDKSYFIERNRDNDTILVWLRDSTLFNNQQLKTLIRYPFTDSTGKIILKQDTILMRFLIPKATRARVRPAPFKVTTNLTSGSLKPGQEIVFKSETPFRPADTSRIRLYEIEGKNKVKNPFNLIDDSTNSCRITMNAKLQQGKNYQLIAEPSAFGNIYGEHSDSVKIKFNVKNEKYFGTLELNIKNYTGNRIIQLLSSGEKLIQETIMKADGKIKFIYIDQGKYRLRVIYDINGDGKWTTGDFLQGRQPEPASYYRQEIPVREGWVANQDWDITVQNEKKLKSATNSAR